MLLLKSHDQELHAAGRLVKASEAATVADAEAVLAAARAEADRIREEAKAEFERQKAAGYEKGLADGKAEIMMQKLDLVESSVSFMESVEDRMAGIVMKALRKCVDQIGDEDLVVQIVRKAMKAVVRNQRQLTVRVAPAQVANVKAHVAALQADFPSVDFIEVAEDAKLGPRACVVETEAGVVDAAIDTQLAAIEKSIRKNFAKG